MREKNYFESWYEELKNTHKLQAITFEIKSLENIGELSNFFLVCKRIKKEQLTNEIIRINITCKKEYEYRVRHYLHWVINYGDNWKIIINNYLVKTEFEKWTEYLNDKTGKIKKPIEYRYFRRLPLIMIDSNMYAFLSKKVCDISYMYGVECIICDDYEKVFNKHDGSIYEKIVFVCINNLIGDIDKNTKQASIIQKEYFLNSAVIKEIQNMPFLALLIFSMSIRSQIIDKIEDIKNKIKKEENKTRVRLKLEDIKSVFPSDIEIRSDIHNAWDIADGLLQLIENVVVHAGGEGASQSSGEGIFSLHLHKNEWKIGENRERKFDYNSEIARRYNEYFKGYINEEDENSVDIINNCQSKTKEIISDNSTEALYEKTETLYNNMDSFRNAIIQISDRKNERRKIKYFLEVRIADYSGENMCDVFRRNLEKRDDENKKSFDKISVKSFFDPSENANGINEIELWKKYYKGENAIQHFGLQIFLSIVSNNKGGFEVRSYGVSCDKTDFYSSISNDDKFENTLPGTAYNILLPMKNYLELSEQLNTFLNADINYKFSKLDELTLLDSDLYNSIIENFWKKLNYEGEKNKISVIKNLEEILEELPNNKVLIFDCKNIKVTGGLELLIKSIIMLIANENNTNKYNNIAIINCNNNELITVIRYFLIYYDKKGNCEWMENKQVYLCGENSFEEFLISGRNIQEMLGRVEKLAFSRRLNPNCLNLLSEMLKKRSDTEYDRNNKFNEFNYTPFDLIVSNHSKQTVFEQNVLKVLEKDIQLPESGCKIENTHMRIGSKIHMRSFYEAELLFFNNYYVNRFAYLLAEKIFTYNLSDSPIWLIGYESYSEMLLCRLKQYIEDSIENTVHYSIYENARGSKSNREENFRYLNKNIIEDLVDKKAQIFFVVPINTTLTTFHKIEELTLERLKEVNCNIAKRIMAYLGVIQIRDKSESHNLTEMERKYWDNICLEKKSILSNKLLRNADHIAHYLILTTAKWENPLECEMCYPTDCLYELPLIETDRTSVVPTQLIGLKKRNDYNRHKISYESQGDISSIRDYFYFDHVERGTNHYQIYMRTAHYYTNNSKQIDTWLKEIVKNNITSRIRKDVLSFDVLVNPLHFSNAAFVEAVNENVFNGASYTLRIEVEKEFKENVETKFSDIEVLYNKLVNMKLPAEINIHYVDDSINLGGNYTRMKHLVSSLFSQDAINGHGSVKVNIFKTVIVLINRLSHASILDYVDDINDFYYYLDIRISSMRTHEDACYLCKEFLNAEKIISLSATNKMSEYWKEKSNDYGKKSLHRAKKHKEELENKDRKYYERYYKRIECTHILNNALAEEGESINEPQKILKLVVELLLKKKEDDDFIEYLIAYLYAYATPFVSYRKSAREGAFLFIIILFEYLIIPDGISVSRYIQEKTDDMQNFEIHRKFIETSIKEVKEVTNVLKDSNKFKPKEKYELLKFLMKLLVDMKSNYIMRDDRIGFILNKAEEYTENNEMEEFITYYAAMIKKLLTLNSDESKSAKLTKILNERSNEIFKRCNNKNLAKILLKELYIENIAGIRGIINNVDKLNNEGSFDSSYNEENYIDILKSEDIDENCATFLLKLKKLCEQFQSNEIDVEKNISNEIPFYHQLCDTLCDLLCSEKVWFALKDEEQLLEIDNENKVRFNLKTTYKIFGISSKESDCYFIPKDYMNRFDDFTDDYLLDTLLIDKVVGIVKYKIPLGEKSEKTNDVFIGVRFNDDIKENFILKKMKLLLIFRPEIMNKLFRDFNNNIIQEWIEKNKILDQLRKARSNTHTPEDNIFDKNSVWTISQRLLFGDEKDVEEYRNQNKGKTFGCILGLMMNIRIARSNVLLLSNGDFAKESLHGEIPFEYMKPDIKVLKNMYFYDRLKIVDKKGKLIGDEIFTSDIYAGIMAKGKEGWYLDFRNYLLYIIFELFHSAVENGKEEYGQVEVKVYKEGQYLFFENLVKESFSFSSIMNGLRRVDEGISLATISEYFIYNYNDRFVKINEGINEDKRNLQIGIPIFAS